MRCIGVSSHNSTVKEKLYQTMQLTAFKPILARRNIIKEGGVGTFGFADLARFWSGLIFRFLLLNPWFFVFRVLCGLRVFSNFC